MSVKLSRTWPLFLAAAGVALLGYALYRVMTVEDLLDPKDDPDEIPAPDEPTVPAPPSTHFVDAERVLIPDIQDFVGELHPGGAVPVRAPQGMRVPIIELLVESGDMVEKGDLLMRFSKEFIESEIGVARAAGKTDDVERFKEYLALADFPSPVTGQVAELYFVNPGDVPLDDGIPLLTISDPEAWNFYVSVPDELVRERTPMGTTVSVTLTDDLGTVQGTVVQLDDNFTNETAIIPRPGYTTLLLHMEAHAAYEPGLLGAVHLPVGEREVVRVPSSALVERGGVMYARVFQNGEIKERSVLVEKDEGSSVLIRAGILPLQAVVVPGSAPK